MEDKQWYKYYRFFVLHPYVRDKSCCQPPACAGIITQSRKAIIHQRADEATKAARDNRPLLAALKSDIALALKPGHMKDPSRPMRLAWPKQTSSLSISAQVKTSL